MEPEPEHNEAVNLLSLDGGGVRGVSSLVILDDMMVKIQRMYGLSEIPKPCEFFHMIAGTSTGGLITIMLGRLRMSTKEALQEYDNCSAKIFSSKNKKRWSLSERFRATALQEAVEDIVKRRGMGERMWDTNHHKGKAIVCVMPADNIGEPRLVRSFPGDPGVDDQWDRNITIWQAARATTAASSFFKPQRLGSGLTVSEYIDAAIGVNNPVEYLLREAVNEFGSARKFGCVVSIGTGTRDVMLRRAQTGARNLVQAPTYYFHLINTLKSTATDGEETHRRLRSRLLPFPGAYYRFNVPGAAAQVKLNDYQKIPVLKDLTAAYVERGEIASQIRQVAKELKTDAFDHGLTLGHVYGLDKDQVILSNTMPQSKWASSGFFTGRQDILEKLDAFFSPRDAGQRRPRREILLHGMGGVGKTEIALKFAETPDNRFRYIFFIDGSSPVTILQSYANIAKQYGLGTGLGVGVAEALRGEVMRWMEQLAEEWLMIFDDCNLSDRRGHLPGRGKGNIIYTSRSTALTDDIPSEFVFEITPFEEADAIELLLKASGSNSSPADPQDVALAKKIVGELEFLPLAIDKAAAVIRYGNWSLGDYLQKLGEQKVRTSSDPRLRDEDVENPTVYAALELSYDAIMTTKRRGGSSRAGRAAALALKALSLLCFYHHKGFPVMAVGRAARHRRECNADTAYPLSEIMEPHDSDFDAMLGVKADGSWDDVFFSAAVRTLQSFSLVKVAPDQRTISMHVLVHSWARQRMEKQRFLRQCLLARIVVLEAIETSWKLTAKSFARSLGPHIDACFSCDCKDMQQDGYEALLLTKAGWHLHLDRKFAEAEDCLLKAVRLSRMEHGNHGYDTINVLDYLGELYHDMGRLGEAEVVFWEIIERLRERERHYRAYAITAAEKQSGEELGSRGASSEVSKKNPRFLRNGPLKQLFARTPTDPEAGGTTGSGGPRDPGAPVLMGTDAPSPDEDLEYLESQINFAHSKLARVYIDQGRPATGKKWLAECVRYFQGLGDHDNPQLIGMQIKIKSLTDPGNMAYWDECVQKWMDPTNEDFFESESCLDLMVAYANCLLKNNKWSLAYDQYRAMYHRSFKRTFGRDHHRCLELLRRMVDCLVEGERYDDGLALARECVRRARRAYGEIHTETVLALQKLYEVLWVRKLEFDEEGEAVLREALVRAEVALGTGHMITVRIRKTLELTMRLRREQEELVAVSVSARGRRPLSGTRQDEDRRLELMWEGYKVELEEMKATYGEHNFLVKRFARFLGDSRAKTKEEVVERMMACFGPHSSLTKQYMRDNGMDPTALVEAVGHDGEVGSSGAHEGGPTSMSTAAARSKGKAVAVARVSESRGSVEQDDGEEDDEDRMIPKLAALETRMGTERRVTGATGGIQDGDAGREENWPRFKNEPIYICGMY